MNSFPLPASPFALWGCGPLALEIAEYYLETCRLLGSDPLLVGLIDVCGSTHHAASIQTLFKSFNLKSPYVFSDPIKCHVDSVLITVGSTSASRHAVYSEAISLGFSLSTYVHHSTFLSPSAIISPGTIIMRDCFIGSDVVLFENVLLNNRSSVAHDVSVGKSTVICPGVNLSGYSKVGDECFLASMSLLDNYAVLPRRSTLSALSFYRKKSRIEGATFAGNPAKRMKFPHSESI